MTMCRGVRGATTTEENTREAIVAAARQLLCELVAANDIDVDDVASVFFTTSPKSERRVPCCCSP